MVVTFFFWTVTEIFFFSPLFSVIVIVALPVFFCAVSFPDFDTLTIFVLLDFQEATLSPAAMAVTFSFVVDCLVCSRMLEALTFIYGFSLATVLDSVRPQRLQVRVSVPFARAVGSFVLTYLLHEWPKAAIARLPVFAVQPGVVQ